MVLLYCTSLWRVTLAALNDLLGRCWSKCLPVGGQGAMHRPMGRLPTKPLTEGCMQILGLKDLGKLAYLSKAIPEPRCAM